MSLGQGAMKRPWREIVMSSRKLQEGVQRRYGQHGTYVMVSGVLGQVEQNFAYESLPGLGICHAPYTAASYFSIY